MTTDEQQQSDKAVGVARRVAAEDLAVGDVVAVLRKVEEVLAWDCPEKRRKIVVHRPMMLPTGKEIGFPVEVRRICLPFVFGVAPGKQAKVLDVRQMELVRLDAEAWLEMDELG